MEILFFIFSAIFGVCMLILKAIAYLFNWTYEEASVYINLYFQYGIVLISCLSVFVVSVKKVKSPSIYNIINLIVVFVYNVLAVYGGWLLYMRYGILSASDAFTKCKSDLMQYAQHLKFSGLYNRWYSENWTEYFLLNILIFIVGFLLILILNRIWRKLINKYI